MGIPLVNLIEKGIGLNMVYHDSNSALGSLREEDCLEYGYSLGYRVSETLPLKQTTKILEKQYFGPGSLGTSF